MENEGMGIYVWENECMGIYVWRMRVWEYMYGE